MVTNISNYRKIKDEIQVQIQRRQLIQRAIQKPLKYQIYKISQDQKKNYQFFEF